MEELSLLIMFTNPLILICTKSKSSFELYRANRSALRTIYVLLKYVQLLKLPFALLRIICSSRVNRCCDFYYIISMSIIYIVYSLLRIFMSVGFQMSAYCEFITAVVFNSKIELDFSFDLFTLQIKI